MYGRNLLLLIRGGVTTVVVCSSARQHLMWNNSQLNSECIQGREKDLWGIELLPKLVSQWE